MDPDIVRLILLVFGVLLVAGIYLWDRYKRAAPALRRPKRSPSGLSVEPEIAEEAQPGRAEPTMGDAVESIPEMRVETPATTARHAGDERGSRAAALDPDPADIGDWSDAGAEQDPQFSMDLNFDAHGDGDYLHSDPALHDEVERKIVVINLVRRDGGLSGTTVEKACTATGMQPGEMSIYHRHEEGAGRVLFSMASMVEPGSFPFDAMDGFSTPGLTLFTQLPGARDGIEIYNEMLETAERLAQLLHAELQDERHNKLTRQMQEHTRESIIEHRRRLKLARSRH